MSESRDIKFIIRGLEPLRAVLNCSSATARSGNDLGTQGCYTLRMKGTVRIKTASLPGHYDSYLLRIWRGGEENQWRWMLQNIRTGEQKGFRDMDALVMFLNNLYGETGLPLLDSQIPDRSS